MELIPCSKRTPDRGEVGYPEVLGYNQNTNEYQVLKILDWFTPIPYGDKPNGEHRYWWAIMGFTHWCKMPEVEK